MDSLDMDIDEHLVYLVVMTVMVLMEVVENLAYLLGVVVMTVEY